MNDLPTIEKSLPLEAPGYVDVNFYVSGVITFPANTAGATCQVLGGSSAARITPAGPTNFGHVDVQLLDSNNEIGRARVVFLIPVSFS